MAKILTVKGEVKDKEFTIDLENPIQTRYEMLRECSLSKEAVEDICQKYGYPRTSYYFYKNKFRKANIEGLISQRPGPKGPVKVTEEIESLILQIRFKDPSLSMYDIWEFLKEKGYKIGLWSVFAVLKKHGVTLKKTKAKLQKV